MTDASDEILAECALAFKGNSEDCNKYVKAVSAPFFDPDLFTGPNMNADTIISSLRDSADWTNLENSHDEAIAKAKSGQFVIAGMTSSELQSTNGHLAVVVSDDGQMSGTVRVPICYAGGLNPVARVQRKRVSETFGAQVARDGKISYFARDIQTLPAVLAVSRLVDELRGMSVPTEERMLVSASAVSTRSTGKATRKATDRKKAK